jgi:hypothetical protein
MSFLLTLVFVALAVTSSFFQASDNKLKKIISPGLTAFTGLVVLYGAMVGNVPLSQGLTVAIALFLLTASDTLLEQSEEKPGLFPLAMVFGVVSGLMFGVLLNLVAMQAGVPLPIHVGCLIVGVLSAIFVYRFLDVEPGLKLAVYIYLVQAIILLAGGLASLFAGQYAFAVWGILIFISDALVGIRAFPSAKRPIAWLTIYRILLTILTIYYTAQYAMVAWAL